MPGVEDTGAPASEGTGYGNTDLETSDAKSVIPADTESESWVIKAHQDNSGVVYLGWDDDVTTSNGFPLEAGDGLSVDINNSVQAVYGIAAAAGDSVRYMAVD